MGHMNPVIFCDFDGTITQDETFVGILRKFTPQKSEELIPRMYDLTLTLKDGVRALLESVESRHYPEMLEIMRTAPLRKGFLSFLDYLNVRNVSLIVVTGGLEDFVRATLGSSFREVHSVYGLRVGTDGPFLKVFSDWESGTELVSKPRILDVAGKNMRADPPVLIGDSVTDLEAALACPVVFARDRLAGYLSERQKDYLPFDDFTDIQQTFEEMFPVDA